VTASLGEAARHVSCALSLSPPARPAARSGTALGLGLAVVVLSAVMDLLDSPRPPRIAIVGTALFGHLAGHDPAAFVGAAGHALLLAIAFLAAAWGRRCSGYRATRGATKRRPGRPGGARG
jgi:xanthosine utilization system XapX-like protein